MTIDNDPDFKAWAAEVHQGLVPKIASSGAVVSLVPDGEADIKFALELGLSLMMDKPIILAVDRGRRVPDKLVKVADAIVEIDLKGDPAKSQEAVTAALQRLIGDGE